MAFFFAQQCRLSDFLTGAASAFTVCRTEGGDAVGGFFEKADQFGDFLVVRKEYLGDFAGHQAGAENDTPREGVAGRCDSRHGGSVGCKSECLSEMDLLFL